MPIIVFKLNECLLVMDIAVDTSINYEFFYVKCVLHLSSYSRTSIHGIFVIVTVIFSLTGTLQTLLDLQVLLLILNAYFEKRV